MKDNFCDKAKIIKPNNICRENDKKDQELMQQTKKKVLKNSLQHFDYLADCKMHQQSFY